MTSESSVLARPGREAAIDDLDRAILTLAARINTANHDLLVLIRRFDERGGWLRWGFDNCAAWLHWRCDLSLSAAREKVRVAHALKTLPAIAMDFAKGELSYSKVRALTRVAGPHNEEELLTFALCTTASRVEERCRELRCGTAASTDEANRAHARRGLTVRRDLERGTLTVTVELPLETGELIDKALDRARDAATTADPEFAEESWAAQQADALVAMARSYLGGGGGGAAALSAGTGTPDNYQVTVHVDHAALTENRGRSGLPIESVRRLGCDAHRVILIENEHGEPLSVGRKTRIVPAAIMRALWARDKGCRFPGCGRRRFIDAHHIEHWANGGETSLANLMLLCTQHHRLLHEGGFTIEKDFRDRWFFRRPDGIAVPACGYRPEDMTDDDVDAGEYLSARTSAEGWTAECTSAEVSMTGRTSAEASTPSKQFEVREPSAEAWIRTSGRHSAEASMTDRTSAKASITYSTSAEASTPSKEFMVREPSVEARVATSRRPSGEAWIWTSRRPSGEAWIWTSRRPSAEASTPAKQFKVPEPSAEARIFPLALRRRGRTFLPRRPGGTCRTAG